MNNGAQVIPGALESLFFLKYVDVDLMTLTTLVIGTALGGIIGGYTVSHLKKGNDTFRDDHLFFYSSCFTSKS